MKNKKLEKILLKNTLSVALPAMALFVVLILMFLKFGMLEQAKCNEIGNVENLEEKMETMYNEKLTSVKYVAEKVKYTGFDYVVDGKIKGAYYYSVINNKMYMFLLKTDEPKQEYDNIEIKGKIIKDNVSVGHIISQLAAENNLNAAMFTEYCCGYIISEPDYPHAYIAMVYVFFASPIIVCILIIIYVIMTWMNPLHHSQTKQLEAYGEIDDIIAEINEQLSNKLLFKKGNIYITTDYMLINYINKTDIIKLDYIKYLSKNLVESKFYKINKKEVFRLTMSNPEKLFYEVDFTNEELIDDIVTYIRGVNS